MEDYVNLKGHSVGVSASYYRPEESLSRTHSARDSELEPLMALPPSENAKKFWAGLIARDATALWELIKGWSI
jgi:hypothetical protein